MIEGRDNQGVGFDTLAMKTKVNSEQVDVWSVQQSFEMYDSISDHSQYLWF